MPIVAEHFDTVVGVDTHAATHTLVVVTASTGAELARAAFPTSPAGLTRAVAWIQRHGSLRRLVVIEGGDRSGGRGPRSRQSTFPRVRVAATRGDASAVHTVCGVISSRLGKYVR